MSNEKSTTNSDTNIPYYREIIKKNREKYSDQCIELLKNNAYIVDDTNFNEFASNMSKFVKLGGKTDGMITPSHMGEPYRWIVYFSVISLISGIGLMIAGYYMVELLYAGAVLLALSILAIMVYQQKFSPQEPNKLFTGHFCVMDLTKPTHYYQVFYLQNEEKGRPELATIWKFKYDNTLLLNHKREGGDYYIDGNGNIQPVIENSDTNVPTSTLTENVSGFNRPPTMEIIRQILFNHRFNNGLHITSSARIVPEGDPSANGGQVFRIDNTNKVYAYIHDERNMQLHQSMIYTALQNEAPILTKDWVLIRFEKVAYMVHLLTQCDGTLQDYLRENVTSDPNKAAAAIIQLIESMTLSETHCPITNLQDVGYHDDGKGNISLFLLRVERILSNVKINKSELYKLFISVIEQNRSYHEVVKALKNWGKQNSK
jgi:hypothetical protein